LTAAAQHETSERSPASKQVFQALLASRQRRSMIERFTPAEYLQRSTAGELWQLVDVREPWEIEIASLAETINIPMGDIPTRHTELDPARPVAVLCHSGGRSARVAAWLARQGYARVANIEGGIDAWAEGVDASLPRY
jgi:rhodanese-related sulfurtransferase